MNERIAKYILKGLSEDEEKNFLKDLDDNLELREEYIASLNIMGLSSLCKKDTDADEGYRAFEKKQKMNNNKRTRSLFMNVLKYSAIVIVAMTIATLSTYIILRDQNKAQFAEIKTEGGDRVTVSLPDGTKVWLGFNSQMRYPSVFNDSLRSVSLDGEAFFEVAENKKRPFVVHTSKYDIKVTGTEFNLMCYDELPYFEASLISGGVDIYSTSGNELIMSLKKQQQARFEAGKLVKTNVNLGVEKLWKSGEIYFKDTSLKDIFERLSIYYDVDINVLDEEVLDYVYTGTFNSGDPLEDILRALQNVRKFNFELSQNKKQVNIR
ncbi:MAG: FecR family protein [Bacteroidales bacterium]